MLSCSICKREFGRGDNLQRHMRNKHNSLETMDQMTSSKTMTFKHPFSMVVSGPSGSGKSVWTKKLLLSSLIQPSPERIIWCYGQWQPLYDNIRKRIPRIEFVNGIPDHLNNQHYIDVSKRNVLVFDDLMTEAKCDQRIADLFTKGSHHRNISVVYLTQNLFPQGKACRDIILNTQYMVLFNNPIDRQQIATLARRIYPSTSAVFMKRFERATSYPYGHLVIDLNSDTAEKDRLHTEIFDTAKRMDEKMAEDRGSIGSQYEEEEEEEEERGGGLRKRRRIEEEEEEEEDEEEEGNMSVISSDLPPGRQEHQEIKEHTICLANHTNSNDCFLRQLIADNLHRWIIPQAEEEAAESYPDMDPESALEVILEERLPEIHKMARELLRDQLVSIYYMEKCPLYTSLMNTAERLHRNSHLSVPLAIKEAIRLNKPKLTNVLVKRKPQENSDE